MSKVEKIEAEIAKLSAAEIRQVSKWLAEYTEELWDRQIKEDNKARRLDKVWQEAEKDIASGETQPLDDFLNNH